MSALSASRHPGNLPKLRVYVDETGDRGLSATSSPFFAMTALLVPDEDDWRTRFTAAGLRSLIHNNPQHTNKPLHWVEHFKKKHPERRRRAAQSLADMTSTKIVHVIVPKEAARTSSGLADGARFYNYTTRLLMERVAYAAAGWDGGPRLAIVRLGTVKGMDHKETAKYLTHVRGIDTFGVPWSNIKWPPKWEGTSWDGIQLADLHAGLLGAALTGDPSDDGCAENLLLCKGLLYRSPTGRLPGYGVKVYGCDSIVTGRSWWEKLSVA
ncbi:DUF3800 domain-containing protein [Streptomyces albidoflavus]